MEDTISSKSPMRNIVLFSAQQQTLALQTAFDSSRKTLSCSLLYLSPSRIKGSELSCASALPMFFTHWTIEPLSVEFEWHIIRGTHNSERKTLIQSSKYVSSCLRKYLWRRIQMTRNKNHSPGSYPAYSALPGTLGIFHSRLQCIFQSR